MPTMGVRSVSEWATFPVQSRQFASNEMLFRHCRSRSGMSPGESGIGEGNIPA
jgi:hypothetical protein